MKILSKSLGETEKAAKVFLKKLLPTKNRATIVALSGNLGSGKTTFVQAIAKLLGVKDRITSPTFVIMKRFTLYALRFTNMVHIDAYRLKSGDELLKLGWDEMLTDPQKLIFIEWPENVADIIPKDAIKINFQFVDETTRQIQSEMAL